MYLGSGRAAKSLPLPRELFQRDHVLGKWPLKKLGGFLVSISLTLPKAGGIMLMIYPLPHPKKDPLT